MKHLFLNLGLLVAASLACASARAACSHTVTDLASTSTIVVIAGPNETCEYHDNNAVNWRALSVAGVVVPSLGGSGGSSFTALTVAYLGYTLEKHVDQAYCTPQGLICSNNPESFGADEELAFTRSCSVSNGPALTATATCLFYFQSLDP